MQVGKSPTPFEARAPFRSQLSKLTTDVCVTGVLPEWLQGDLVRTAPAVFDASSWHAAHWFDGLGMLYGFRIGAKGQVSFRQQGLKSETARAPGVGSMFATRGQRGLFDRLRHPAPRRGDNTNVNVLPFGDELVALTETSRQWVIDRETLEATKYVEWKDELPELNMLAHPQFDFEKNVIVNVGTQFGRSSALVIFEHEPNSRVRRVIAQWPTLRVPYMHSFGLTSKHAVLIAHPLDVSSLSLLFSNKGYIEHFQWKPEQGTRFVVFDRATGAAREHLAKSLFVFHTVNTFEDGNATVIDFIAYDDASIIHSLSLDSMANGFPDLRSRLMRARLTPAVEAAELTELTDTRFELPTIHYRHNAGRPYRHLWGAGLWSEPNGIRSRIVKIDSSTGASSYFEDGEFVYGEPLFVGKPSASAEDDGVLVTIGSHLSTDRACLQVIDAQTMQPVARAEVSVPLPLGFHGSFLPQQRFSQIT